MTMTCLMVLLVALGKCFLWKYVFDAHEGHRGASQFLASYQGGKRIF